MDIILFSKTFLVFSLMYHAPISVLKLYHENIPSKIEVGTFFEDGFGTIYPQVVMAEFKQKLTSII